MLDVLKFAVKTVILAILGLIAIGLIYWLLFASNWSWLPQYWWLLVKGLWLTLQLFFISCFFGMILAVPIGLVQVTGPRWLAFFARWFCTLIRGTPLLIQLWLLYFALGSLFPSIPWLRTSSLWPFLRDGYY